MIATLTDKELQIVQEMFSVKVLLLEFDTVEQERYYDDGFSKDKMELLKRFHKIITTAGNIRDVLIDAEKKEFYFNEKEFFDGKSLFMLKLLYEI